MVRLAATVLVAGLLSACQPGEEAERQQAHFHAMGTRIDLTLIEGPLSTESATRLIESHFEVHEQRWDGWGGGELGRLNQRLANDGQANVPASLRDGIEQALLLGQQSEGLFHPGIGALVETWSFHRQPRKAGPPPSEESLHGLLESLPPVSALQLDSGLLRGPGQGFRLDLGGFAKGLSLDRLHENLDAAGLEHGIINAGGDLLALGRAGGDSVDARAWRIGILDPRGDGVLAGVTVTDGECVMTSGDYERTFEHDGEAYHHILDPRTGHPADASASVTVISTECARADAAATALFVAGPGAWPELAAQMEVDTVMLVTPDGQVELSPAMEARIEFDQRQPDVTVKALP
ncbi:FAD:protein FMN transferase [Natronospira sp.]|uniref:FAD:protein FMN transferase n=1 Tax=Natronospira sp. TaxID=2024970 RepID=UPI0038733099